jgi:CheY-like chemotaxis protein
MQHILTASNSDVLKLLGSRACARLGLARHIVASGEEAVSAARRLKPRLVVLDADMPDTNGCEACRRLKAEPELKETRVMLVLQGPFTREKLGQAAEAGCDDLMILPALDAEFFAHVADLLGLPRRRGRRVTVELLARVDLGTRSWEGFVENLSATGAKVQLLEQLPAIPFVHVWLRRQRGGDVTELDARVVWRQADGRGVGLEFRDVDPAVRARLEAQMLWDVALEGGQLRVYLEGDFVETTDFSGLDRQLAGTVDFDASGVRYINSHGAEAWAEYLRELDTVEHYTFSRCSVAFTMRASMRDGFIGDGHIVSLMVPFHCEACDREDLRLLQVAAIVDETGSLSLPRYRCSRCGGRLTEEAIPESYFGFLPRG